MSFALLLGSLRDEFELRLGEEASSLHVSTMEKPSNHQNLRRKVYRTTSSVSAVERLVMSEVSAAIKRRNNPNRKKKVELLSKAEQHQCFLELHLQINFIHNDCYKE